MTHFPLTQDGNKHTHTEHPLPDFYLRNTCKFTAKWPCKCGRWGVLVKKGFNEMDPPLDGSAVELVASFREGLDHGVGHPLLFWYDEKAHKCKNSKYFNGLRDSLSTAILRFL
jgi:hypothetical protein